MFRTLAISSSQTTRRSSLGRLVDQSTMLLMAAIGALIIVLAMLILFHQNANATKGYMLRTLNKERSRLQLQEEVLKLELTEEQSLESIESDAQIKAMIEAKNLSYTDGYNPVATGFSETEPR